MSALRVDPVLSFAHRVDGSIRVVLEIEGEPTGTGELTLRLVGGGQPVDVPATVASGEPGRYRVEALVAAARVTGATRRMRLVEPGVEGQRNLQTRLLVRDGMPVALLPGRRPDTVLAEPRPRSGPSTSPSRGRRSRAAFLPGVGRLRRRGRAGA